MKQLFFYLLLLCATAAFGQDDDIKPAAKGVVYGTPANNVTAAISAEELAQKTAGAEYSGRITGKVTEVCQAMGCWFKIEKKDGTALMVKTKDHGYFLPQNLVGKTVAVDGVAKVKEVTEAQRRHLAEDAGKTKAEIEKIKGTQKGVQLVAAGVQVLD
jgi:hypothetical protein